MRMYRRPYRRPAVPLRLIRGAGEVGAGNASGRHGMEAGVWLSSTSLSIRSKSTAPCLALARAALCLSVREARPQLQTRSATHHQPNKPPPNLPSIQRSNPIAPILIFSIATHTHSLPPSLPTSPIPVQSRIPKPGTCAPRFESALGRPLQTPFLASPDTPCTEPPFPSHARPPLRSLSSSSCLCAL